MFEAQRLLGDTTRAIVVETRRGTRIVNEITVGPIPRQIEQFRELLVKHPRWEVRKPPTGGYNCFGLVWAGRRTGIFDEVEAQVERIFVDDGYRVLPAGEVPQVGDLALYWESPETRGNLYHIGVVIEYRPALLTVGSATASRHPWVLSKLDAFLGEVLHHYSDVVVYPGAKFSVEYWTERPVTERMTR